MISNKSVDQESKLMKKANQNPQLSQYSNNYLNNAIYQGSLPTKYGTHEAKMQVD